MLLEQVLEAQASGMKGRSFTTGHDPLELTKHRITSMVRAIFPKVCPEICGGNRENASNTGAKERALTPGKRGRKREFLPRRKLACRSVL